MLLNGINTIPFRYTVITAVNRFVNNNNCIIGSHANMEYAHLISTTLIRIDYDYNL